MWTVIDQDGLSARLRLTFTENISGFAATDLAGLGDCTVSPDSVGASIVELSVVCPFGTRTPTLLENSVTDNAGNTGPTGAVSHSAVTFTAPSVPSSPESPSAPTDPGGDSDPSVAPPSDPGDDGTGDSATPTTGDTAAGGQGYANPTDSTVSSPINQTPGGTLPATGADTRRDVRNSVVVMIVGLGFVMFSMRRRRDVSDPIT